MTAIEIINLHFTEEVAKDFFMLHGAKGFTDTKDGFRCSCPLHNSNNKTTFGYNIEGQFWYCFVENIGGNVVTFVKYYYNLHTLDEAVKKTATLLNINIDGLKSGIGELLERVEIKKWISYVNSNRNKNEKFEIKTLGARYSLNEYRAFNKEFLKTYGVTFLKDLNRICFPIYDIDGETIGASLRRVNENDKIKWLHKPVGISTGNILYNLNNCKSFDTVYIVEGIIDALRLIQLGIKNVVATFGARITKEQFLILSKYFINIILAFDNDDAGRLATTKSINMYKHLININVLDIKDYKDVGGIYNIEDFNKIKILRWYEWK